MTSIVLSLRPAFQYKEIMDSLQLASALPDAVSPHAFPLGVFPRDKIPSRPCKYPSCFIANTDVSDKPGTHWIAYFMDSPYHTEFFDSFGHTPSTYDFSLIANQCNSLQFQSDFSLLCGQFCIYYLYHRSRGITLPEIQTMLSSSQHLINDKKVNCFAHKLFSLPHLFNSAPCYCKQSCCSRRHAI